MTQATDRALQFRENEAMFYGADQATQGAPTVAGTEIASASVSAMGPNMQQTLASVMNPAEPIDMGHVASLDIRGLQNIEGIKMQQTPEVSDFTYSCKAIGNVAADAVQSVSNIFSAGEFTNDQTPDPALAVRAPQPQFAPQRPTFGFG